MRVESIKAIEFEDPNGKFYAYFEEKQWFKIYLPSQIPMSTQSSFDSIKGIIAITNYSLLGTNVAVNIFL